MQEIEKLRLEIDQIHVELARLFKQRLSVTEKIWQIKKANSLPLIDQRREQTIVHRFDTETSNLAEQLALQNFFKSLIFENKKYLEAKIK